MSRLHLISLLCVLVASALCARWSVTVSSEPADVNSSDSPALQSEFSISGLSLGMTREEVEAIYGPGRTDGEGASYGRLWKLASGDERFTLSITYNEEDWVTCITGRVLRHRGRQVHIMESGRKGDYREVLKGFGPADRVLMGAFNSSWSTTHRHQELGVDVHSSPEGRWYRIYPGWVD